MWRYLMLGWGMLMPFTVLADDPALDMAIRNARIYCLGLSDELNHLKTMAGINTAVTGVGTAVGVGATAVGIAKSARDREIEELEKYIDGLRASAAQQENVDDIPPLTDEEMQLLAPGVVGGDGQRAPVHADDSVAQAQERLDRETAKSKNLGNWRTGLMAANTATNVAGTIIAANNTVDDELQERIDMCVRYVRELSVARMSAHVSGGADARQIDTADKIVRQCGAWETANLAQINARARGAMISSGVGTGIGLAGTITSAIANTNKTRNDNTDHGRKKEQNLNTAANVLAGGATVASGVATIFNATQIGAVRRAVEIASSCEGVL
ncbi:MAG: hypothetical protein K2L94_04030 [Alphaproteobacteria bacterium]|nr:hypothetical protein [Alphaproteobacteria bacterium]